MALLDFLGKAYNGLVGMSSEMLTCISVAEGFSDEVLIECLNKASKRSMYFMGTPAEDINFTTREMACRKVATDRGSRSSTSLILCSNKDRISFQHSSTAGNPQNLSSVFLQIQFGVDSFF